MTIYYYRQLAELMMPSDLVSISIITFLTSLEQIFCQLLTQGTRPNYVSISARVTMRLASTQLRVQLGHRPCGMGNGKPSMEQT